MKLKQMNNFKLQFPLSVKLAKYQSQNIIFEVKLDFLLFQFQFPLQFMKN